MQPSTSANLPHHRVFFSILLVIPHFFLWRKRITHRTVLLGTFFPLRGSPSYASCSPRLRPPTTTPPLLPSRDLLPSQNFSPTSPSPKSIKSRQWKGCSSIFTRGPINRSHQSQVDESTRSSFMSKFGVQTGGKAEQRLTGAAAFSVIMFEPFASLLAAVASSHHWLLDSVRTQDTPHR